MLDAILSPDRESRYYSFNAAWADGEKIASMRNGLGDEYSIVFSAEGVYVRAHDLLRVFGREGRLSPLRQAFSEYGRIDKTMHLLARCGLVDDIYRRRMNRQLTVQESRHQLARAICHGKRGRIVPAYREGQEDQLAALGLVLNAVALWTTRYLDAAIVQTGSRRAAGTRSSPPSPRRACVRCATRPAWRDTDIDFRRPPADRLGRQLNMNNRFDSRQVRRGRERTFHVGPAGLGRSLADARAMSLAVCPGMCSLARSRTSSLHSSL